MGEEEEEQPLGAEDGLEPAIKGFCEGGRNCFHNGGRHRTGAFFNHFLCAQDCSDRVAVLQCITQVMADGGGEVVASSKLVGAVIATSVTTITTILRLWSICLAFSSVTVWMHVDAWLLWWGDTDPDEATATEQGPLQCSDTQRSPWGTSRWATCTVSLARKVEVWASSSFRFSLRSLFAV